MNKYFGYVRVSTAKQGEGVSLEAQRDAITRYAERSDLEIERWFEEKETAAKRGRPIFTAMLKLLRKGKAQGVLIHKIDRSARNLKDWADLGELIDSGIDVHFANESLDLHSRGGRLSADIQAVVAADYIRNLREETKKGFYGRVKQGLYPLPAPLGYLDLGKGKAKEIDPVKGPLIRRAFELYGSGRFNLILLQKELHQMGLRNRHGNPVTRTGLSTILNNPFYIGLIRLRRTNESFSGAHEPLISRSAFDRVQAVLDGRTPTRLNVHDLLFRRLLICKACGYGLTGERQKNHVYYRCHTRQCLTTGVREERVAEAVRASLSPLTFSDNEHRYLETKVALLRDNWGKEAEVQKAAIVLRLGQCQERLGRLTDAFLDGTIEKVLFEERKVALLMERREVEDSLAEFERGGCRIPDKMAEFFELAGSASILYESGLPAEKRELLRIITSNRQFEDGKVELTLAQPFALIAERAKSSNGPPYRDRLRTLDRLLSKLSDWLKINPATPTWASLRPSYQDSKIQQGFKRPKLAA